MAYSECIVFDDVPAPEDNATATAAVNPVVPPTVNPLSVSSGEQPFVVDAPNERFTVKER